jgi:hypothetical protein
LRGIPTEARFGAVGIDPGYRAAGGIDRAGQVGDLAVEADAPVVVVVVIGYALAVVGAQYREVRPAPDQGFILLLHDQVAIRDIHRDPFAVPAASHRICIQLQCSEGIIDQTQAGSGCDFNHDFLRMINDELLSRER